MDLLIDPQINENRYIVSNYYTDNIHIQAEFKHQIDSPFEVVLQTTDLPRQVSLLQNRIVSHHTGH